MDRISAIITELIAYLVQHLGTCDRSMATRSEIDRNVNFDSRPGPSLSYPVITMSPDGAFHGCLDSSHQSRDALFSVIRFMISGWKPQCLESLSALVLGSSNPWAENLRSNRLLTVSLGHFSPKEIKVMCASGSRTCLWTSWAAKVSGFCAGGGT